MIENANILLVIMMAVPFMGVLFTALSKDGSAGRGRNALSVGILTIIANLLILWITAHRINVNGGHLQIPITFRWLDTPKIELLYGIDAFSLSLIAAVHISILLGFVGVRNNTYRQKTLVILSLLFLDMLSGYLLSGDLFSFYIFFEAMLLPLFMLVGIFGEVRRKEILYRFFMYNLLGAMLLFMALCILFHYQNVTINDISRVSLRRSIAFMVWGAIFLAFLSRIPIWPFHYWISSVNVNISNPLVFIIANILPLTGVYGLIRFFPLTTPDILEPYLLVLEIISIMTMVVIALIGFSNKDIQYKIFSYMTVYYILYLLGALLPTDTLLGNITFSLFSWLVVVAAIEVMVAHIEKEKQDNGLSDYGLLNGVNRCSIVLSFFVLAAVGMPLSSMFLNNMLIFAGLLNYNLKPALFILAAIMLSSLGLLQYMFYLKYPRKQTEAEINDISMPVFAVFGAVMFLLAASFVNPLWYME